MPRRPQISSPEVVRRFSFSGGVAGQSSLLPVVITGCRPDSSRCLTSLMHSLGYHICLVAAALHPWLASLTVLGMFTI